jgi:DNA primase
MIDVDTIKHSIDCRTAVERDLGPARRTTPHYSLYKCPLHHEQKGLSLVVYATHWQCFGKCGIGGDVIAWTMRYHNLTFPVACDYLTHGELPQTMRIQRTAPQPAPYAEPPTEAWQKVALDIAHQAVERLWQPKGQRALDYLKNRRGLDENIIRAAQLGLIAGDPWEWKEVNSLKVPCGISIPWYAQGAIWGIKVRRSAGEQRYQQVSGGNIRDCLYLADDLEPGLPIFLTEGEFDALIAKQVGGNQISPASIGSVSNRRINHRWFGTLLCAPKILVCMDTDTAGINAAAEIAMISSAVRVVQVPKEKDFNAFYLASDKLAVVNWLELITR